jgi:pre-mRNA-splicing factor SYF1
MPFSNNIRLFFLSFGQKLMCLNEATKTVDASVAVGKPHTLWCKFAQTFEHNDDLDSARTVFDRGSKIDFKSVEDLSALWCERAEMEIRGENYDEALKQLREAVKPSKFKLTTGDGPNTGNSKVHKMLHKSIKVWNLLLDLEESLGDLNSARTAYEKVIEMKIATPRIVLNYAALLEEDDYFEDSFQVYEKGIALFKFPHVLDIWAKYLDKFVERYGGKKLERARDLFEQVLADCPKPQLKAFFIKYGKLEEDFGLVRHAVDIYNRACTALPDIQQYDMFIFTIHKVQEFYGASKTREIYEKAITVLPDVAVRDICIKYASMEQKLGEIDRARAIYIHGSQFSDPRVVLKYWKNWRDFEVAHGNQDTYREMLQIKRSVQTRYAQVNYVSAELTDEDQPMDSGPLDPRSGGLENDAMGALEAQARNAAGDAAGATGETARGLKRAGDDIELLEKEVERLSKLKKDREEGDAAEVTTCVIWGGGGGIHTHTSPRVRIALALRMTLSLFN